MLPPLEKIKGTHPGKILERELRKQGIGNSVFARQIGEFPTIITDIVRQRRGINVSLSLKLDREFNAEEGYFYTLQAYYKIYREKSKHKSNFPLPDMSRIRDALFWDIDINNLDFDKRKRFVIERIFERGNDEEMREIIRYYGKDDCREIILTSKNLLLSGRSKAEKYLGGILNNKNGTKTI